MSFYFASVSIIVQYSDIPVKRKLHTGCHLNCIIIIVIIIFIPILDEGSIIFQHNQINVVYCAYITSSSLPKWKHL